MKFIANAFSLQMLQTDCNLSVTTITEEEFNSIKNDAVSCVGHEDTAKLLHVECNRQNIKLNEGDVLFVAQLTGGRLPEGTTELPEGFCFSFKKVELMED